MFIDPGFDSRVTKAKTEREGEDVIKRAQGWGFGRRDGVVEAILQEASELGGHLFIGSS